MTLVCSPHLSMPSDVFCSGLDTLPSPLAMGSPPFPDPNWGNQPSFLFPSYEEKPMTSVGPPTPGYLHTSLPEYHPPTYSSPRRPPPIQIGPVPSSGMRIARPKSSPSTFGPNVEEFFAPTNPFRSKTDGYSPAVFSVPPPSAQLSAPKMASPYYASSEYPTPNTVISPNQARVVPLATDSTSLTSLGPMKRGREDDELSEYGVKKRKRAPSQPGPIELSGEEQLLLRLKEEENLPWKDIAVRFQTELGKTYQVPALQMRFKRLRERMRTWTENDVSALEQAYEYWEKFQFEIIAAKMLDFGATERWPAKHCARKWEEMHPYRPMYNTQPTYLRDPWDTTTSPVASTISHLSPRLGGPL